MMNKKSPDYYSKIAAISHKKSPRTKAYYRAIQRKSVLKRKQNQRKKLSPV